MWADVDFLGAESRALYQVIIFFSVRLSRNYTQPLNYHLLDKERAEISREAGAPKFLTFQVDIVPRKIGSVMFDRGVRNVT